MTADQRPGQDTYIASHRGMVKAGIFFLTAAAVAAVGSIESPVAPVQAVGTELSGRVGDFVKKCITVFELKTHARAERPTQDIVGTRVKVFNVTNPGEFVILTADTQQDYRAERGYRSNTYREGTFTRTSVLYGEPTGERDCDGQVICIRQPNTRNSRVQTTELVLMEIDSNGDPVTGKESRITADCPSYEPCDKWAAWAVEAPPPVSTSTPTATAVPTLRPTSTPTPVRAPAQAPAQAPGR